MSSIQTPNSPSTSNSLLLRACGGEAIAWQRVVQIYGPLVYSWARKTGLQPQDAADVTQETFLAISTRLAQFRADRPGATFRGWLRTIARNKAADLVRQQVGKPKVRGGTVNLIALEALRDGSEDAAQEASSVSDSIDDDARDKQAVIRRIMSILRGSFEKNTWQAFWRMAVDGCSPDEVAIELGMSRWAVYKARARVLQKLRDELAGLEELE
jgi:RNA polymerase sigma-70 factor, ECF subfamily